MTRLLIIDDHAVVRQGLVQAFCDKGFDSIETAGNLKEGRAIILSLNDPAQFVKIARSSGANAYLSKSQSMPEIISSVTFALLNPGTFTSNLTADQSPYFDLTPREIEVLYLLAEGASNLEISSKLYISISTVKTHISALMRKLQCTNRTAAAKIARDNGFLL